MKDEIFKKKLVQIPRFDFNEDVASVFDDMVERSIPFYHEIHRLIVDLAGKLLKRSKKELVIYDLGCSTGTTIVILEEFFKKQKQKVHFIGVDQSEAMLKKCEEKFKKAKVRSYELIAADLTQMKLKKADFVIMNYTLQFIAPKERLPLLKRINACLFKKGFFLLSEKIHSPNKDAQSLITELYYDFKKRNGYSELEIAQKREALEKFLITKSTQDELTLLKKAGLTWQEQIFRWYNFAAFLGIK